MYFFVNFSSKHWSFRQYMVDLAVNHNIDLCLALRIWWKHYLCFWSSTPTLCAKQTLQSFQNCNFKHFAVAFIIPRFSAILRKILTEAKSQRMHNTNPTCYATVILVLLILCPVTPQEISLPIICTWIIVVSATPFVAAPPQPTRTVLCLNEYSLLIYKQYGLTGLFF